MLLPLEEQDPVRLIQITDTHLHAAADGHLLGMQTLHSLRCVLDIVRADHRNMDAFLVTGDLSQDGSIASYQHLKEELSSFQRPSFWLEGNHDHPDHMIQAASGQHVQRVIRTPHWQILMLNSQVVGKVYGELSAEQLALTEKNLAERPDLHTMICMHHHPISMESLWIDNIGVKNADALLDLIGQHQNARAVLWGHVHQASDIWRGDVRFMSTPSTCVQFMPKTENFSLDDRAPGYRWLNLMPDGSIETAVHRVENIEFDVDFSVTGY